MPNCVQLKILSICYLMLNLISLSFSDDNERIAGYYAELSSNFAPIYNYAIEGSRLSVNLIEYVQVNDRYECFHKCLSNRKCLLISIINEQQCRLYNKVDSSNFVISLRQQHLSLFEKDESKYLALYDDLAYHWPFDANLKDVINEVNSLYDGVEANFIMDKYNRNSHAVMFNQGFYHAESSFYFHGDFTLSVWIRVHTCGKDTTILKFGANIQSDSVELALSSNSRVITPIFKIVNDGIETKLIAKNSKLIFNKWQHLAVSLDGTVGFIYINGLLNVRGALQRVKHAKQTSNFIGAFDLNKESKLNPIIEMDDLKIFNRSLAPSEIFSLLNSLY